MFASEPCQGCVRGRKTCLEIRAGQRIKDRGQIKSIYPIASKYLCLTEHSCNYGHSSPMFCSHSPLIVSLISQMYWFTGQWSEMHHLPSQICSWMCLDRIGGWGGGERERMKLALMIMVTQDWVATPGQKPISYVLFRLRFKKIYGFFSSYNVLEYHWPFITITCVWSLYVLLSKFPDSPICHNIRMKLLWLYRPPNAWGLRAVTTCWPTCGRCCQREGACRALVEWDLRADLPASAVTLGLGLLLCHPPPTTMLLVHSTCPPAGATDIPHSGCGCDLTCHDSLRLTHHSPLWMGTSQ